MSDTPTPTPRTDALLHKLRHQYKLDDKGFKQIEIELTAARQEIERLQTNGIHSCHDQCQRPNCVLRRELKDIREMYDGLLIDHEELVRQRDRLAEESSSISLTKQRWQKLDRIKGDKTRSGWIAGKIDKHKEKDKP